MSWTNWGFDGTINEAQWSQMAGLLGNGYVAAGNGDCLATAVVGSRAVSVAAGTLYGDGVVSVNSGAETVAMTTPVNGQWYVIALRRTWATNTAALVAIAGATTSTTTPTAPPTSFPTLNTNAGVLTDQPIAWAWCNSANTTVVVYDIRLKAVKSLPPVVANQAERDAKFMTPTQGLQVFRNDMGLVETYHTAYDAITNPGGRDSAGFWQSTKTDGLVPCKPTTATIVSGTGSSSSLGLVSFSNATSVSLDNVFFGSVYKSFRVLVKLHAQNAAGVLYLRMRASGTDDSSSNYHSGGAFGRTTGAGGFTGAATNSAGQILQYVAMSDWTLASTIDIFDPNVADQTTFVQSSWNYDGTGPYGMFRNGMLYTTNVYDGLTIYASAGAVSGTVEVFGYNG